MTLSKSFWRGVKINLAFASTEGIFFFWECLFNEDLVLLVTFSHCTSGSKEKDISIGGKKACLLTGSC